MNYKSGKLSVASGATIGGASAYLDATGQMDFGGQLALAAGGALSVNARAIDLGSALPGGAAASGIQFDTPALDLLSQLSELTLNSYDKDIRLYGNVSLGGAASAPLAPAGRGTERPARRRHDRRTQRAAACRQRAAGRQRRDQRGGHQCGGQLANPGRHD